MNSPQYIDPISRLKLAKHVGPIAFDSKYKTPRFHIEGLELLEKRYSLTLMIIFRGGSKTTIFNKLYIFTEIFLHHEPYVQVVSKTNDKAKSFTRDIKKLFESAIKKGYAVHKGSDWSDNFFEVIIDGEYSCIVHAVGAGEDPRGLSPDFKRPTLIVVDDLESRVGRYPVHKQRYRDKLKKWYDEDLIPGLHPEGRVIFMGTILHKDSLLATLRKENKEQCIDVPIISNGKPAWKSRFPLETIMRIKGEWKKNPSGFYREYLNKAVADEKVLFKEQYFKYFSHMDFMDGSVRREVGNEIEKISMLIRTPTHIVLEDGSKIPFAACTVHTIMDIADAGVEGDRTAMVTCATHEGKRYVLEIKSGYWSPHEKGVRLMETYLTFRPRYVGIEIGPMYRDLAASIEVLLKKEGMYIPIEPISHGGVAKNTRIANLQPAFVDGRYYFNRDDPNTMVVEAQLSSFDESADSDEDDEMDALAYHEVTNNLMFSKDEEYEDDDDGGMYSA